MACCNRLTVSSELCISASLHRNLDLLLKESKPLEVFMLHRPIVSCKITIVISLLSMALLSATSRGTASTPVGPMDILLLNALGSRWIRVPTCDSVVDMTAHSVDIAPMVTSARLYLDRKSLSPFETVAHVPTRADIVATVDNGSIAARTSRPVPEVSFLGMLEASLTFTKGPLVNMRLVPAWGSS